MKPSLKYPLVLLVFGLALVYGGWWLTRTDPAVIARQAALDTARHEFLENEIKPLLISERERNQAAKVRARALLAASFNRYKAGVPAYLEEITSWGAKYKITKSTIRDKLNDSEETRAYADELFARHVVSPATMNRDLKRIVAQFQNDLVANRNTMLTEAATRLSSAGFIVPNLDLTSDNRLTELDTHLKTLLTTRASQAPMVTALAVGSGIVAEEATRMVITRLAGAMAARLGTGLAVSGGATAAGAAGGGTAGTPAGPVGIAIGIAAGVAVGWVVDLWMERNFKEKVGGEINTLLDTMQHHLWTDPRDGLNHLCDEAIRVIEESHGAAFETLLTSK